MITGTTRLYAIIGDPIAHVRTPMAFNDYFSARYIDAVCLPIHIGRDDLPRGWAGLKSMLNLDGFIVTAPHKAESARLCDRLEGDGVYTQVANTVRREADGRFVGTLLDGRGFVSGMKSQGHASRRPPLLHGGRRRRRHRDRLCAGRQWRDGADDSQPDALESRSAWSPVSQKRFLNATCGSARPMPPDTTSSSMPTSLGLKARRPVVVRSGKRRPDGARRRGRDETGHDAATDRRQGARFRHPLRNPYAQRPAQSDDGISRLEQNGNSLILDPRSL